MMKKLFGLIVLILFSLVLSACELEESDLEVNVGANIPEAEIEVVPQDDFEIDTEITLTAPEVEDFVFVHWIEIESGEVISTDNPYQFTLEDSVALEAVYDSAVVINISSELDAAIIDVGPSDQVVEGEDVTIEATAPDGYVFEHWFNTTTGEVISEANPYSFVAEETVALEAIFVSKDIKDAEEALDDFDHDFGHMDTLIENFETTTAMTMEMEFSMQVDTENGEEIITVNLLQRTTEVEPIISETILTLSAPDMPQEDITMHIMVEETENFYEAYVDIGFFLDMLNEEEDFNAREIFAIDNDILHIVVPSELREAFSTLFLDTLEEEFTEEPIDEETLEKVLEDLNTMKATYDLAYFTALGGLDIEAEIVDENDILTTVMVNPEAMGHIFEDIFKDAYAIMLLVDDTDLPTYEEVIQMPDYQEILWLIDELEAFEMTMRHTPSSDDTLTMHLNLHDYLTQIDTGDAFEDINAMDFTITMRDDAEFSTFDTAKNIYDIAEEFFMITFLDESLNYLKQIDNLDNLEEGTYSIETLTQEYQLHFHLPIIDYTNSTITIDAGEIYLDLIYEHNQEPFFNAPVSFTELKDLGIDQEELPETREAFLAMLEPYNQDNLNIYQILIELMHFAEEIAPEDPIDPEPTPKFPEEDLVQYEDLTTFPRYPESILIEGMASDVEQIRIYLSEADPMVIYDYYDDYIQGLDAWEIVNKGYDTQESIGYFELSSETQSTDIVINPSPDYESATEIIIYQRDDDITQDPQDIPEEDTVALDDIEGVPRFPDSVLIEGFDKDGLMIRNYLSDGELQDIYQFYFEYYDDSDIWSIVEQSLNVEASEGYLTAVLDDMTSVIIAIYESETYADALEINVQYSEED